MRVMPSYAHVGDHREREPMGRSYHIRAANAATARRLARGSAARAGQANSGTAPVLFVQVVEPGRLALWEVVLEDGWVEAAS